MHTTINSSQCYFLASLVVMPYVSANPCYLVIFNVSFDVLSFDVLAVELAGRRSIDLLDSMIEYSTFIALSSTTSVCFALCIPPLHIEKQCRTKIDSWDTWFDVVRKCVISNAFRRHDGDFWNQQTRCKQQTNRDEILLVHSTVVKGLTR